MPIILEPAYGKLSVSLTSVKKPSLQALLGLFDSWDVFIHEKQQAMSEPVPEERTKPVTEFSPADYYHDQGYKFTVLASLVDASGNVIYGRDIMAAMWELSTRKGKMLYRDPTTSFYCTFRNFKWQPFEVFHFIVSFELVESDPPLLPLTVQ